MVGHERPADGGRAHDLRASQARRSAHRAREWARGDRCRRARNALGPAQAVAAHSAGLPMAGWSMRTSPAMPEIADIVVVTEPEWIEPMQGVIAHAGAAASRVARRARRRIAPRERLRRAIRAAGACDGGARARRRAAAGARRGRARRHAEVRDGRGALLAAPVVDTIKVVGPAIAERARDARTPDALGARRRRSSPCSAICARAHDAPSRRPARGDRRRGAARADRRRRRRRAASTRRTSKITHAAGSSRGRARC